MISSTSEEIFSTEFHVSDAHDSETTLVDIGRRLCAFQTYCSCNWTSFHHQMQRFLLCGALSREKSYIQLGLSWLNSVGFAEFPLRCGIRVGAVG
jgi:hypothetical protein